MKTDTAKIFLGAGAIEAHKQRAKAKGLTLNKYVNVLTIAYLDKITKSSAMASR